MILARSARRGVATTLARPVGVRAVALDLDGTTLTSAGELTARTRDAIAQTRAAGIEVMIATGRPAAALQPVVDTLGLADLPCVCFNGAARLRMAPGAAAAAPRLRALDAGTVARVLDACAELDLCASAATVAYSAAGPTSAAQRALLERFEGLEGIPQARMDLRTLADPAMKIVAIAGEGEADQTAVRLRAALGGAAAGVHLVPAEMHIEVLPAGVSKGAGVAELCADLGVPLAAVAAFGDHQNDIECLAAVGYGVAMQNAHPLAKKAARRVSAWSNDEEGVARELELLLFWLERAS